MTTSAASLTQADMDKLIDEHLACEANRDLDGVRQTRRVPTDPPRRKNPPVRVQRRQPSAPYPES